MNTQTQDWAVTQAIVDTFNRFHPVGSQVAYVDDLGRVYHTSVTHPATVMSSGTAVVWLSGRAGAYSLSRVIPIPSLAHVKPDESDAADAAVDEVKNELPTAVLAYLCTVADEKYPKWLVAKLDEDGYVFTYFKEPVRGKGAWEGLGSLIGFIPKSYGIDWKTWEIRRKAAVEADTRHLKTEWVVGVDKWGEMFIIAAPDIAPHFLEYRTVEEIGIEPYQWPGTSAGVYLIKCEYEENHDPETGMVDDYRFRIVSIVKKDD